MKVVTGEVMQEMDRRAIAEYHIPGLTLMERAGDGCVQVLLTVFGRVPAPRAVIVAGKGNNGGDGYVIARLLRQAGWLVDVWVLASRRDIAGDAAVNLQRLDPSDVRFFPAPEDLLAHGDEVARATVVVDAIFGTGLKSPVREGFREVVEFLNGTGVPILAVDIPSGVDAGSGRILGSAIKADLTVTFAAVKVGQILPPGLDHCGQLRIVDIGIPAQVTGAAPGWEFVDRQVARSLLRPRRTGAHKGTNGHLLLVAGSRGKSGAAALAANSAVRGGAGLVTAAVPECIHTILETKTTEAMTVPVPDGAEGGWQASSAGLLEGLLAGKQAVAVGPGIGWTPETVHLVQSIILTCSPPLVLDADGINALSADPAVLRQKRDGAIVMTPHPGEMARLNGTTASSVENDRIGVARAFAMEYGVYLVLKGARTVIATPDGAIAINGSGNPGMGTGGMGDVLTGVVGALLAQGYDPFTACRLGVFLHGHAADLVAAEKGEIGMSAVDVLERLPLACKDLLLHEPA